jgi:uncharacterized repeat protein (TIGR01451 family)
VSFTGQTSGLTDVASTPVASSTVVYASDLSLNKTHTGSIVPGTNVTYTLTPTNNGPSVNPGPATITDTLPTGLTFVPAGSGGNGWSCTAVGQAVTCTLGGPFPVGAIPAATIIAAVSPTMTGATNNTATVSSPMFDTNNANNGAIDNATVVSTADLVLAKTHTGSLVPGGTVSYHLAITNPTGPSTAQGPLTISENLPAGLSLTSYTGSGWTCTPATATGPATITCTNPSTLAVGASTAVDMTMSIAASIAGSLSNGATASSTSVDPTPANNSSTDGPAPLVPSADLVTSKSHIGSIIAGQNVTYKVDVTNNGLSDAAGPITIVDTLPAGFTFVSSPTAGWSCTGTTTVTCTRAAALPVTGSTSVDIVVAVASTVTGSATNSAVASSASTDPVSANNTAIDTATVVSSANLSLSKGHTGAITAGSNVTYNLTVLNSGPSSAAGPLSIVDTLPAGLTVVSASAGWTCAPATGTVTCTNPASLASGGTNTLNLTVAVDAGLTGTVTNTATVSSATNDPTPANNSASDGPNTVSVSANLAVTKSHTGAIVAGTNVTYTVNVNNPGPSNAAGPITVTDTLPAGMTFVSTPTAGWTCAGTTIVACTKATGINATTSSAVALVVAVAANTSGSSTNSATASSPTADPNLANNTGTDIAPITTSADLEIKKTHVGGIVAGGSTTYNITVKNLGPSDAVASVGSPITVVDTLPTGMTFVSASGAGWSCTAVGQVVTCVLTSPIANGTTVPLDIATSVSPTLPAGTVTNTADITTSPAPDPVSSNNSATDAVLSVAAADLSVSKGHTDRPQRRPVHGSQRHDHRRGAVGLHVLVVHRCRLDVCARRRSRHLYARSARDRR